jgi:hypothetical protein
MKEAVLARDGRCVVCGRTEGLSPHHLDSHADGGKSDMTRLVTLCLARCQGAVHDQDVILRVEEDGTVTALDRDGKVIGKPQSAAEVLAEADEACPLETIERREASLSEAATQCATVDGQEAEQSDATEAPVEMRRFYTIDDLPSEVTASQWRTLERWIEWSPSHRAFLFRPDGGDIEEGLDLLEEAPQASAAASEGAEAAPTVPGLRPESFDDFVGQRRVVENLLLAARAAKERGEPLGHVLLSGPAGLGKTTAARLLARECGAGLVEVLAGNIGDPHQLISLLCRLAKDQLVIIEEK